MSAHNTGTLRVGNVGGSIVSDTPSVGQLGDSDCLEYYGGYLVAESATPSNAARLIACWNALRDLSAEQIEDDAFVKMRADRDELLKALDRLQASERAPRNEWLAAHAAARETISQHKTKRGSPAT